MKIKIYQNTIRTAALGIISLMLNTQSNAQVGAQGLKISSIDYSDSIATVKVKAVSLTNILAVQGTITFNTSSLQFISAAAGSNIGTLTGTFANNATLGYITYSVTEPSANTVSVATDTILMTLKFRVINNPSNTFNNNNICFSNTPTPLEIDTTDIAGGGIPVQVLYPAVENHTCGYVSFARSPFLTYIGGDIVDTVTNRPSGCTYQWLLNGSPVTGPNASTYASSPAGTYTLQVTYPNGVVVVSTNSVLPIKLSKFSGKYADNSNQLSWSTSTENNTNIFEIERSENGSEFTKIGSKKAIGNSTSIQNYIFNDVNISNKSVLYYRLKTIDNNGSFGYSNIIKIAKEIKTTISLYPNPSRSSVNITGEKIQQITVNDLIGKIVITKSFDFVNNTTLNIAGLAKGIYSVNIKTIDATKSIKLIVE